MGSPVIEQRQNLFVLVTCWVHLFRSQDVSKEQQAVSQAFIEPDSGRVLKILTDGSILILQGWKKPIETSGNTLTVPAFTNVQAFPNATEPASLAATDQGQQFLEDSMEALRYHERRGSSQHVPELLPRAHSAPATVAQVKNAGDGLEKGVTLCITLSGFSVSCFCLSYQVPVHLGCGVVSFATGASTFNATDPHEDHQFSLIDSRAAVSRREEAQRKSFG